MTSCLKNVLSYCGLIHHAIVGNQVFEIKCYRTSLNVYSTTEMWLDEFLCLNVCPRQISFSRQTGSRKKKDQCTLNLETGKQTRRCSVPFQQRWECKKQTARLLSNFICIFSTLSYKNQSQRPNISQLDNFSKIFNWLHSSFLVHQFSVRARVKSLKMRLLSELLTSKSWDASIT